MIDPALRDEIHGLELALARRDAAGVGGGLASVIAEDFLEFGASGRTLDAEATRELLVASPRSMVELVDFELAELGADVLLATYRIDGPRPTNRSSIWVRRGDRWVMRFHQGTPREG